MCLKTYNVDPWSSLIFENDVSLNLFKLPIFAEHIVMSLVMHTKYLTTGYHVSEEKYTPQRTTFWAYYSFSKPLPTTIKDVLEKLFP